MPAFSLFIICVSVFKVRSGYIILVIAKEILGPDPRIGELLTYLHGYVLNSDITDMFKHYKLHDVAIDELIQPMLLIHVYTQIRVPVQNTYKADEKSCNIVQFGHL